MRMILAPRLSGADLRVRITNRYRSDPAYFDDMQLGIVDAGASLVPGTQRPVTVDGASDLKLDPGQDAVSDPIHLAIKTPVRLAFSAYLPGNQSPSAHGDAEQVSYLSQPGTGDVAGSTDGSELSRTIPVWLGIEGVDVRRMHRMPTIVALGDSLTDGWGSGFNANARYPDVLAARARHHRPWPTVVNAGIAGDALRPASTAGTSALARLRADVLDQPHLQAVVVEEGINDLRNNRGLKATTMIDAYRRLLARLHAHGVRVMLATIAPTGGEPFTGGWVEPRRERINAWIRGLPKRERVDFDRILRDPSEPLRLRPAYDSGDHLHPSAAGYDAMARGVRLDRLLGHG